MRKSGVFSTTIFLSVVLAGVYGILHDQVTASISEEYFTRLKFPQFRLSPGTPFRTGVSLIGFYATWWMGGLIGIVLGLIGFLLYPDHTSMQKALNRSLLLVFTTTILLSVCGYLYGNFYLADHGVSWWMPDGLYNKHGYIVTGSIHNFSYAGGLCGLLLAVTYLLLTVPKAKKAYKQAHNTQNNYRCRQLLQTADQPQETY
jgi:hypothetical protein